jgi:DMSO/TMAO reductase YedYZ molybdopterin-dependent catalytic subunit
MKLANTRLISLILFIAGVLLIISAILVYTYPWQRESINWDLTLTGADGQQMVLTYNEIRAIPAYTGLGGFFTTTGVVNGPYKVTGVPLVDLCNLVGGLTSSDAIMVSASDGYSSLFDYDQIMGGIVTSDPKTLKEVPHGELKLVLMYELGGKTLTQDGGRPLRIAVVGKDGLLTEGNMWIKWVNKIEVMKENQLQ